MNSLRGLRPSFDFLVHEGVRGDPIAAARHRSFIISHVGGGTLALAAFPVYLATMGAPTPLTAVAAFWLLSPLAIALYLARTGAFETAHLVSALNIAGLVTFAAALTGGLASFLIAWMLIVPLEAAQSGERRVVAGAIGVAVLALLGLGLAGVAGMLPPARSLAGPPVLPALIGLVSAMAYAGCLAIAIQAGHERSVRTARMDAERYRLLAENTSDIITRHAVRGEVLFASLAARHIVGVDPRRLAGSGLLERVHLADRPAYLTALARCAARAQPVASEFRLRRGEDAEDGEGVQYVWVEMRCQPVPGAAGGARVREIVAVTRDIAEHKRQEADLLKARDQAESASRAKTQFLASMSHELRTPLNAIIGFSEILARELFGRLGEQRYRDYARLIHESGEHLLSVVNEILDMSKIEAGKYSIVPEPFEIAGLVRSCCDILRQGAEKKFIRLEEDVPPGLPELVADKRACKQMLLNLLSNAIKFTQGGGWVRVSVRRDEDRVRIAVADDGIGISKADLPRLGDPFVQADTSYNRGYDGAGLGLSVVKGLARLHGGALEMDSDLGRGTVVTIILPLEATVAPAAEDSVLDVAVPANEASRAAIGA